MLRIPALALAGVLAIGLTSAADARGGHGGHSHGGVSHGSMGARSFSAPRATFHASRGIGVHRGFYGGRGIYRRHAFVRGHRFYRPYYYGVYRSCYRWRQVLTPWGWRVHRVNVCRPWYWRHRHWRHRYVY